MIKSLVAQAVFCVAVFFSFTESFASTDLFGLHPRPKVAYPLSGNAFSMTRASIIVTPDVPSPGTMQAIAWLQRLCTQRLGDTLLVKRASKYSGGGAVILIGEDSTYLLLQQQLHACLPVGETLAVAQGYVLDVNASRVVLAGATPDGTFNGVSTLMQLVRDVGPTTIVPALHILDYPDYPIRWVFSQHNLRGDGQLQGLRVIEDTMAFRKLNGIAHGDYKYNVLALQPNYYFDSVRSFKNYSKAANVEIIPQVFGIGWSDGILYNDPNLAEGLEAHSTYIMEADTGRLVPYPGVTLSNGNFESVRDSQFIGWGWYDGPNQYIFVDSIEKHSGKYSARCTNFTDTAFYGNCRISMTVNCAPNHYYLLSAWIKTQNYAGAQPEIRAANTEKDFISLTFSNLSIPSTTTGWTHVEVVFNTLQYKTVTFYIGEWGARSGTLWWDDFRVQEIGLENILRRKGTPVHIRNAHTGVEYRESVDVTPIVDPAVAANHGSYGPYHTPPTLRRVTSGAIRNGDSIIVSYFHPFTSVSDENGNGSVMSCVSDDTLSSILSDQMRRIDTLFDSKDVFMGHDEIRNMNHDSACLSRNTTPAHLLADNLNLCMRIVDTVHHGARRFVWSDMFDSLHNAHDAYYLINGDLTGDWNYIDTAVTIVNWNGGLANQSMTNFARMGFHQVSSPYYDVGDASTIRAWRLAQEGVKNCDGMMYTTWAMDYRFLTAFADYAWGAGPYIVFAPLDSTVLPALAAGNLITLSATVLADANDVADRIDSVSGVFDFHEGEFSEIDTFAINSKSVNTYEITMPFPRVHGFRYHLRAVNKQKLTRVTPTYVVGVYDYKQVDVHELPDDPRIALSISPDPASTTTSVRITVPQTGPWTMSIVDMVGRIVEMRTSTSPAVSTQEINTSNFIPGAYRCVLATQTGTISKPFVVLR